jgi:dTDP-4-amino-4,6-dideoxygalactose transaminase
MGLFLTLKWFGVKEGDEVIIPAYTYCATALAVKHAGAKIVMVDVGQDFNISTEAIRKAITPKTKVIIPVDFGGFPCDYNQILELVDAPEIKSVYVPSSDAQKLLGRILVLSDAAHSIGAYYMGKRSGSLADMTVFSFHAVKNITSAEGGAICINMPSPFNNSVIYAALKLWSLNGQTKDAFTKCNLGAWEYDIILDGYKANMTDLAASIAIIQLNKYDAYLLPLRKSIAEKYNNFFSKFSWAILPTFETEEKSSSYHLYPLRIKNVTDEQRKKIVQTICDQEISVNVHFIPLPMLTLFKNMGFNIADFPVAYKNYSCEISLPIYPQLTGKQIESVCNSVLLAYNTL